MPDQVRHDRTLAIVIPAEAGIHILVALEVTSDAILRMSEVTSDIT